MGQTVAMPLRAWGRHHEALRRAFGDTARSLDTLLAAPDGATAL
ncbi:MAG: hypothetical protein ACOH16_11110 [Propionibacteriaceae bacterium]